MATATLEPLQPTMYEKLMLPVTILTTLAYGAYVAVVAPFRGPSGASTYKSHVGHAIIRTGIGSLSVAQLQWISPFMPKYEAFCKKIGQAPDVVTLKSGVKCVWVGPRDADYVCLYFHGGGFNLDADDGHALYWHRVSQTLSTSTNKKISFCLVLYSLAPQRSYPTQLHESLESLDHLLTDLHLPPSKVVLAGDSAGGNMVLAILSALAHGLPSLTRDGIMSRLASTATKDAKFKAAILVAPWVSFANTWPSVTRNAYKDIIALGGSQLWSANYLGTTSKAVRGDAYSEPITETSEKWWKEAGGLVERMLCVCGRDEVLVDSIEAFMRVYQAANPHSTTLVVAPNEIHIQPILYAALAPGVRTKQGEAIEAFLGEVLADS